MTSHRDQAVEAHARGVPTPVLATKLFTPTRRPDAVSRTRLTAQIDATLAAGHRLTLVSAPAGFGKTTLVSEWLDDLDGRSADVGVGWLSLDEDDDDRSRFLAHTVAALRQMGVHLEAGWLASLESAPTPVALGALVNHIASAAERAPARGWVLVLDDYHVITASEIHEALSFLLDHMPPSMHLVLLTRADPPLPLARLRARGHLTELRAVDLRFTSEEAGDLLTGPMGLDLTAADVDALGARTEGWVAGLQLAALSLRGVGDQADVTAFIEAFTGSNRFIIDYLADEVLARQPVAVREFLLRTAVLDRLSGPLCDALTDRADGARVLEELERSNLFVVPLDDRRAWYRYHHLFADVLQARLLAEQPDEVSLLHRRASDWYADRGLTVEAVRHALAAEDHDRAMQLMEEALPEVRRARQDTLLLGWVRALPTDVVRHSPVLNIVSAWSALMSGDLDAVGSRLDDAEAALAAGVADQAVRAAWADTEDLRTAPATIAVYRASVAQGRGDIAGTIQHARRALDLAGPDDHFIRGAGSGFLGMAAWAAGDVRQTLETFASAVRSLHAAGNLVDELDSTVVLADMWVTAGRPGRARRLYDEALRTATRGGEPYPRATADLHVGLADLDRERGDLAGAEAHLETARVLRERSSITENRHRWAMVMAGVRTAQGAHDAALDLLDQAEAVHRPGFYPDIRPIAATRARIHLAKGDLESASAWAESRGLGIDDDPEHLHEYEHLTLVRLFLARGRPEGWDQVLGLLERLHAAAADAGRDGSVQEIRMLQALTHQTRGNLREALLALGHSFTATSEPEDYVRRYLDEGGPMRTLLRTGLSSRDVDGDLPGHARRLLEHQTAGAARRRAPSLVNPLSEREAQVLRLLDSELTGPQIAQHLYITLNTLRTHTKHIFAKLDVTTRAAAVRRAEELGLQ